MTAPTPPTDLMATTPLFAGEPQIGATVRLAASRCETCGRTEFPRRPRCPACSVATSDVAIGPEATVHRCTSVEHQPPGASVTAPYVVIAAAFPEGVAVLGVLADVQLDEVAIGDEVETCAVAVGEGIGFGYRLRREGP